MKHLFTQTTTLSQLEEVIRSKIIPLITVRSKVYLQGSLGAGKTTFTRLLLQNLGCQEPVTSPTFTLINEYQAEKITGTIYHIDFYRLSEAVRRVPSGGGQVEQKTVQKLHLAAMKTELWQDLPIEDILTSDQLVLVEWADLFPDLESYFNLKVMLDFPSDEKAVDHRIIKVYWK